MTSSTSLRGRPLARLSGLFRRESGKPAPQQQFAEAVDWIAERLDAAEADGLPCCRILVAAEDAAVAPHGAALWIGRAVADHCGRTLLIDTSQGAASISGPLELPRSPGLAELCQQRAGFEAVIRRDPASALHILASGRPRAIAGDWGPPGMLDKVCRAVDAAYRAAVFCADRDEALLLARGLKRPFSAGLVVTGRSRGGDIAGRADLETLGFPLFRLEQRG